MLDLLRQHLNRANQRMKTQADRKRSDRHFLPLDWVYLKLQPYIQTSVAVRANHKLAFRYFGPFQIEQKIGAVAYKLKLPPQCGIHPVVHVSQLKKALAPGESVLEGLPDSEETLVPERVLQTRLHRAGAVSGTQVLVQWSGSSPEKATWEDLRELKNRFPFSPAWGQAGSEGGEYVTVLKGKQPDEKQEKQSCRQGKRRSTRRERQPSVRYPVDTWVT